MSDSLSSVYDILQDQLQSPRVCDRACVYVRVPFQARSSVSVSDDPCYTARQFGNLVHSAECGCIFSRTTPISSHLDVLSPVHRPASRQFAPPLVSFEGSDRPISPLMVPIAFLGSIMQSLARSSTLWGQDACFSNSPLGCLRPQLAFYRGVLGPLANSSVPILHSSRLNLALIVFL